MTATLKRRLVADLDTGFADLVDSYGSMVFSIAGRLHAPSTAEDIAQETFLRAYRDLRGRKDNLEDLDLAPWLATITLNLVRNERRRRTRKPTTPLPEAADAVLSNDTGAPVEDAALAADGLGRLSRLLQTLPDAQREAIVLRHVAGLSTAETAAALDCPPGTVKSHLSRGLASLRSTLTTHREEP